MQNIRRINEEGLKALDEYTGSCTVVIASTDPKVLHGSGVAVTYGDRQYILTAAHVLKGEPDNEKVRIIGKPERPLQLFASKQEFEKATAEGTRMATGSSATSISIIDRQIHENDDIAALRVDNLGRYLPHTLLHNLSAQEPAQVTVGQNVSILGFPGELAKHYECQSTGKGGWSTFTHVSLQMVKDISMAPEQLDARVDLITDFDYPDDQCEPHGMSGCGAWSIPQAKEGEIWSATKSQLLGILSAYYRKSKLLRFVRIDRIVRLLSTGD